MTIEGCPSCGGEGWIPMDGGQPLSYYVIKGLLQRYMSPLGEMIRWTGKAPLGELPSWEGKGGVFQAGYKRCWCNHEIIHLARQARRGLYWMDEESGQMEKVVGKYLHRQEMEPGELDAMKAYVAQWILGTEIFQQDMGWSAGVSRDEWLPELAPVSSRQELEKVVFDLLEWGIDPM